MSIIKFVKAGIEFEFVVDSVDYSGVMFKFKAVGKNVSEGVGRASDGYKRSAYISKKLNAIAFDAGTYIKINSKKAGGVKPDSETFNKFIELQDKILANRNELHESVVNGLLDGTIKAKCKYEMKWCDGYECPEKIVHWEYDVSKLDEYGIKFYECLGEATRKLGLSITAESLIKGLSRYADVGYCEGEMVLTLNELLHYAIEKKKAKSGKDKTIFDKAKSTGIKQELSRWTDDCNDEYEECNVDICIEYAMPDGTVRVERSHTY